MSATHGDLPARPPRAAWWAQPIARAVAARLPGAWRFRRLVLRFADPLVRIEVEGTPLLAPLSHNLPFYQGLFPFYDTALKRLAGYLVEADGAAPIIDIGANIGDTAAAMLAVPGTRVLAVEGDARFMAMLRANAPPWGDRLALAHCFLGSRDETLSAASSTERGTGRIDLERPGSLAVRPLAAVVAEHPAFAHPALVKIDTDGFDIAILRGALDFLERTRPVLFFEYDPALFGRTSPDGELIFRELAAIGYDGALIYANSGPLLGRAALGDGDAVRDAIRTALGRPGVAYVDLAIFPSPRAALFDAVRAREDAVFAGGNGGPIRQIASA